MLGVLCIRFLMHVRSLMVKSYLEVILQVFDDGGPGAGLLESDHCAEVGVVLQVY